MSNQRTARIDRLFIIGNGFDLHHGIPSRYSHFGEYLASVDRHTFCLLEDYLHVGEDFCFYFEERLADFDTNSVIDYADGYLASYGAEDWSDSGHHDFQYEIEQIIAQANIVIGHGWTREAAEKLSTHIDEDTETRAAEGYKLIDDYFAQTFKPTEKIVAANSQSFCSLSSVDEVWVLGHSIAAVRPVSGIGFPSLSSVFSLVVRADSSSRSACNPQSLRLGGVSVNEPVLNHIRR